MATNLKALIDKFIANPKQLFLVDGLGAFWTAFFLAVLVAIFEDLFGMPQRVVYLLSLVAFAYAVYSFSCYLFIRSKWQRYLKVIAIANVIYCCVTTALLFYFYQSLTVLGLIYFIGEVIIIAGLVGVELMVLFKIKNRKHANNH